MNYYIVTWKTRQSTRTRTDICRTPWIEKTRAIATKGCLGVLWGDLVREIKGRLKVTNSYRKTGPEYQAEGEEVLVFAERISAEGYNVLLDEVGDM